MQKRMNAILDLIDEIKPVTITEVGVWNGDRALEMVERALQHQPKVHYVGYDLFEEATPETNQDELNAKRNFTSIEVGKKLAAAAVRARGFSFELIQGNTRATLRTGSPGTNADLAFIDGGHSVETIRSDYEALKGCRTIVFDDYYLPRSVPGKPDGGVTKAWLDRFGANRIVDAIPDALVLPSTDLLTMGAQGYVHLAVVRVRSAAVAESAAA